MLLCALLRATHKLNVHVRGPSGTRVHNPLEKFGLLPEMHSLIKLNTQAPPQHLRVLDKDMLHQDVSHPAAKPRCWRLDLVRPDS